MLGINLYIVAKWLGLAIFLYVNNRYCDVSDSREAKKSKGSRSWSSIQVPSSIILETLKGKQEDHMIGCLLELITVGSG